MEKPEKEEAVLGGMSDGTLGKSSAESAGDDADETNSGRRVPRLGALSLAVPEDGVGAETVRDAPYGARARDPRDGDRGPSLSQNDDDEAAGAPANTGGRSGRGAERGRLCSRISIWSLRMGPCGGLGSGFASMSCGRRERHGIGGASALEPSESSLPQSSLLPSPVEVAEPARLGMLMER